MHSFGTKELIVNSSENIESGEGTIILKGFDRLAKEDISEVKMSRAIPPQVQVCNFSVTAPGKAGEAIFYIKAKNGRAQAQYHWTKIEFGKRFPISVPVAAGDDAAAIQGKITAAITAQNKGYEDLPFTAKNSTMTGKMGSEPISWEADGGNITYEDGTSGDITWTVSITTPNNEGYGLGKQLEESVTMMLPSNGTISSEKRDELPIPGAKYTSISFNVSFKTDMVPAPTFPGELTNEGGYSATVWINETELGESAVDALLDEMFSIEGTEAFNYKGEKVADKVGFLA